MDYVATVLTTSVLWMPYFNIGLGLSPAWLAAILMILRAWDAVSDPLMGNISDNARTRWGRRRPFIVVGAFCTAAVYPFLWRPPTGHGDWAMAVYLTVVGILFFTSFTCWSMPYYALQLELTPNYDERTRLTAWMTFVGKLTSLAGGWLLAFLASPLFANKTTGKADIVGAMQTCSWYIAGIILVLGLMPAFFVKDRPLAAMASHQATESFWASIRESAHCKPFWTLIAVTFFLIMGNTAMGSLGTYVNVYLVNDGDLGAASIIEGWRSSGALITGLASIPFWTWVAERFDKKVALQLVLGIGVLAHLLYIVCIRPDMPYLQVVPGVLQSGVLGAVWLILPSMKADAAEYEELRTGRRREGSLNAFYSWFVKVALTLGVGLNGVLFTLSGFDVKLAAQPAEVLMRMKAVFIICPILLWVCALLVLRSFVLTRGRMRSIRDELEIRRGVA